ncbi:MAG: SDR family oxidoreductase [Rhizobiales bacterium]|nr:SDR family oxidoreductase [Hyphomicrobiales bacterium]MBO6700007.1 SDR family oxidoreductase [Hyphomicrobiales bacterium]MBO6737828.1 SDR family oxidoreductase [Hyphomicrobiales bacterium]MBO6913115.1 SDR family oxidoreductase [Hyphomicrobiales bacterium]MBO6957095.1 SDR family oxidoreductase [Hyphomicrobiales bacterium]
MSSAPSEVAVITGGSRGIGAATARLLAARGFTIVLSYQSNKEAADQVVDQITRGGGQARAVQADVASEDDTLRLFALVDQIGDKLTVLINNAGIVGSPTTIADISFDRLERMMRTNVIGSIICAREAVNRMALSKGGVGGSIINLSSAAARLGSPNQYVDYAASKGAIDSFTKGLALEVADDGIRVNAVSPGIIETEIHASGGLPDRAKDLAPTVPMKRSGTAEEVAQAIGFLVSSDSSYTTGIILDVTGGR